MDKEQGFEEECIFSFENFQQTVCGNVASFLTKGAFVNVQLICGGEVVEPHKVILAACSPFFEQILISDPHPSLSLVFPDITKDEMMLLLDFMYKGRVSVVKSLASSLLKTAKKLQICGLEDQQVDNPQETSTDEVEQNNETSPNLSTVLTENVPAPSENQNNVPAVDHADRKEAPKWLTVDSISPKKQMFTMKLLSCLALVAFLSQVNAFLGSEDRFMKKYAMMKIYESCFGEGVVRQIRKEMKLASAKCASLNAVPEHHTPSTPPPEEKPADDAIHDSVYQTQPNFDAEKLHQAILAFKPQNIMPQPSFRPYGGIGPASYYTPQLTNPAFSAPMFYPGFQPVQFTPYTFPMMGQQYLGNRIARGMDFNSQFDNLPSRVHGKLRNVSCVMQELGYLDENFAPNYPKINERISNLPVNGELRRDMQEGVTFCQQFSKMDTSTPISKDEQRDKDLRWKILENAVNATPFRRSLVTAPTASVENPNDDQERSSRLSLINTQNRLSTIPSRASLYDTYKFLGEEDMMDHFKMCIKLFTENKISTKNAWDLHIIDLLKHIAQKEDNDVLQLAGTSLDISAKVYSMRVDDIYSDGLKLATSMSRVASKEMQPDLDENGAVSQYADKKNSGAIPKRPKKKSLLVQKKNTICKDPKTLQAPLPKLESVSFSIRTDRETSAISNLFTNTLKLDSSGYQFMLFGNEKAWTQQPDPVIQGLENPNRKKYPLTLDPLVNFKICQPFSDFQLDKWDPDEEDKQLASEKSTFIEKEQEVIFDQDGVPIHELDGSIHDLFENPSDDAEDHIQSVHEEVAPQVGGEIANIVEFTPDLTEGTLKSEYSYNPVIPSSSGKVLDQIWAGPSHWKFKFIKRTAARFSGVITDCKKRAKSRKKKKAPPKMMDFDFKVENLDLTHKVKTRRKPPTANVKKITFPLPHYPHSKMPKYINQLLMKRGMHVPVKKAPTVESLADYEVSAYRYENPNDSQYCSQRLEEEPGVGDNDMPYPSSDIHSEDVEEHQLAGQEFMGENLVDAPEMVPKKYVPYALQAKKMDMKKLKSAVWQNLTDVAISTGKNTQERDGKVIPTTFSKMYEELPSLLPHNMQKELSCPLAFVALLHLCNEENLSLVQHEGNKDFDIAGP